uniref:malectin domain-containing carbohydrate-binding protein n=2 Tax=Flavobacteriaceae TaxID=49546 RepID=UPI003D330453
VGLYASLFSRERWDPATGPEMTYGIPLADGDYVVNLYLGDHYYATDAVGDRVFSVALEGTVVRGDLDLVSEFGHRRGGMLSYPVTVSGGSLEVGFLHGASENPLINAIEIIRNEQNISTVSLKTNLGKEVKASPFHDLTVTPNPVLQNERIGIQFTSASETFLFIYVYDINGAKVYQDDFYAVQGYNQLEIAPEYLSPGMYLIQISTLRKTVFKKIIVGN